MTLAEYLETKETPRWDESRNAGLDPSDLTIGSHRKVWFRCEKDHSWEAAVYSVAVSGCRCPYCCGVKAIPGKTDLGTLHPDLARQWDTQRNTENLEQVLPGSHKKVFWLCEKGHSWQAAPFSRTKEKGSGCPYCTGRAVLKGFNDLESLRPKLAREWYQPLNGTLRPGDVTLGSNKKVWWRCEEHHVWQAAVYSRTRTRASHCPVCTGMIKIPRTQKAV